MSSQSFTDLIKNAFKVNLTYSASLFNLSREYFRDLNTAVTQPGERAEPDAAEAAPTEADAAPAQTPEPPRREPMLLAGRKGEIANAALAINNSSGQSGSVTLQVVGEFPGMEVSMDPETLSMEVGDSVIIRILAKITGKAMENVNYSGVVRIPELDMEVAEFVVCRLPDATGRTKSGTNRQTGRSKPAPTTAKKASRKTAKKAVKKVPKKK